MPLYCDGCRRSAPAKAKKGDQCRVCLSGRYAQMQDPGGSVPFRKSAKVRKDTVDRLNELLIAKTVTRITENPLTGAVQIHIGNQHYVEVYADGDESAHLRWREVSTLEEDL